jgi:hypothetical protein
MRELDKLRRPVGIVAVSVLGLGGFALAHVAFASSADMATRGVATADRTVPSAAKAATRARTPVWTWNAKTATVDPDSAAKVAAFQSYAVAAGTYFEAAVAWVDAPPDTPAYAVPITGQAVKQIVAPIPLGTRPGNTFDQSLLVRGSDGTDYDFGLAKYDPVSMKIVSTDGAAITAPGAASETGVGGANAARFPLGAGPITPADVLSGVIDHPLVISMPNVGSSAPVYPAGHVTPGPGNGLPFGAWLRLDPTVDVPSLGLPPLETMIAVAMQRYGMFVRDIGTTLCIIATDQVNQGGNAVDWPAVGVQLPLETPAGVPYAANLSPLFPWDKLQVLLPPPRPGRGPS